MDVSVFVVLIIIGLLASASTEYELQPQLCKKIDNSCKTDNDCCLGTCCENYECIQSWECSPCKNVTCPDGQSCYLDEKGRNPNSKWKAVCALDDPCPTIDCSENQVCQVEQTANNPPEPMCVFHGTK